MTPMAARRVTTILFLVAASSGAAYDSANQTDAAGALQLNIPLSTRSLGMGGVTSGGNDVLRSSANPALLSSLATSGELAIGGGPQFANQTQFGLGGAFRVNPRWVIGATLNAFVMSFQETDALGNLLPAISSQDAAVGISGAWQHDWLSLGVTAGIIREALLTASNIAPVVTLGATGTWNALTASLAVRNLGGGIGTTASTPPGSPADPQEKVPGEIRVGAAYNLSEAHVTAALEVASVLKAAGSATTAALGVEWWLAKAFAVRAGGGSYAASTGFSLGLTGLYRQLGLDYAFTYVAAGPVHRVGLSYAFGEAAEHAAEAEPASPREEAAVPQEPAPVAPKPGATRLNVAIADLRAENVSAGDAAVMADLLRTEMAKTGAFNMIEKQNMDKVLAEHAFQQTGCTSEECAVKLGKLLNVQRMSVGSFGKLLDSYFLNIRVVNIETGQVGYADSAEGKTVSDLKIAVRDMARRMAKQIR